MAVNFDAFLAKFWRPKIVYQFSEVNLILSQPIWFEGHLMDAVVLDEMLCQRQTRGIFLAKIFFMHTHTSTYTHTPPHTNCSIDNFNIILSNCLQLLSDNISRELLHDLNVFRVKCAIYSALPFGADDETMKKVQWNEQHSSSNKFSSSLAVCGSSLLFVGWHSMWGRCRTNGSGWMAFISVTFLSPFLPLFHSATINFLVSLHRRCWWKVVH